MSYVHQVWNFGLGNFVNISTAIEWVAVKQDAPVKVYFDLPWIGEIYKDCPFIEVLKSKPNNAPMFTSALTNTTKNDKPDYQHAFEVVSGEKWNGQKPWGFGSWIDLLGGKPIAVFICGAGNHHKDYLNTKIPSDNAYVNAIRAAKKAGYYTRFIGTKKDLQIVSWASECDHIDVEDGVQVHYLSYAHLVIANDTGLAHVAGAMNKKMIMFWKDTQLPRCMNASNDCSYLMQSEWHKAVELIEG